MSESLAIIETRDDADADPIGAAVQSIEELRSAVTGSAAETRTAVEAVRADLAAFRTRLEAVEVRANRPGATAPNPAEPPIERRAFLSYVRRGTEAMAGEEVRSLRVAEGPSGGYLAPSDFVRELDRNLIQTSPIRAAARVSSTGAGSVVLPKRTAGMTATWVGEEEERSSTQPVYGQTDLPVHEIAAFVDVSNALLEDSAFNLESELAFDFAEEFGRIEGAAAINGNGVKKPLGLLNTTGITQVAGGHASTVTADGVIDLVYSLPAPYAASAVFGMARTTMGAVRKLKGTDGHYLWADSLAAGQPNTLMGYPVVEMPDMPEVAGNALPIVFGSFMHFRIFDRVSISILRDPYSIATTGKTRFHGRRRLAAGVTKPEAFRLMKIATSV